MTTSTGSKNPWGNASESLLGPLNTTEPYQDEGYRVRQPVPSHSSHRSASLKGHHSQSSKHRPARPVHNRSFSSDPYVSPLAKLKQDHKAASKARHLRRGVPTDTIDSLDKSFFGDGLYHHEGPYDATLASRQIPGYAPVEAVKYSNAQALAATPRANIIDSLTRKVPLQGVGMVPPGVIGPGGQRFDYEEDDIQRSQGKLGRWPGIDYLDADIKGKGEPSFSIEEREKALKAERNLEKGRLYGGGEEGIQMRYRDSPGRRRSVSDAAQYPYRMNPTETSSGSGSGVLGGLKKKLSLRKRK